MCDRKHHLDLVSIPIWIWLVHPLCPSRHCQKIWPHRRLQLVRNSHLTWICWVRSTYRRLRSIPMISRLCLMGQNRLNIRMTWHHPLKSQSLPLVPMDLHHPKVMVVKVAGVKVKVKVKAKARVKAKAKARVKARVKAKAKVKVKVKVKAMWCCECGV